MEVSMYSLDIAWVAFLVKRGCDLLAIKDIMRHSDVQTTMRYLHTSEASKREKYERYLEDMKL